MAEWTKRFPIIDKAVDRFGYWWTVFGPGGLLAGAMSYIASNIKPLMEMGWGAVAFVGIAAACGIMLVAAACLAAWRYFAPLSPTDTVAKEIISDSPLGTIEDRLNRLLELAGEASLQFNEVAKTFDGVKKDIALPPHSRSYQADRPFHRKTETSQARGSFSSLMEHKLMTEPFPDETVLPDDYPVYGDYFYLADGKVYRSDWHDVTVAYLKLREGFKEVRRCNWRRYNGTNQQVADLAVNGKSVMPIEQITKEGDFVIRNSNGVVSFRMHMTDDEAIISDDRRPGSQLIMTIEEAAELRGWLTRQLSAAI